MSHAGSAFCSICCSTVAQRSFVHGRAHCRPSSLPPQFIWPCVIEQPMASTRSVLRGKADGCGRIFCSDEHQSKQSDPWCNGLPYRPSELQRLLEGFSTKRGGSYNEAIIDSSSVDESLPAAVDAFFFVDEAEGGDARRALREFKQTFGAAAATLPLVRLDLNNWAEPFVQV